MAVYLAWIIPIGYGTRTGIVYLSDQGSFGSFQQYDILMRLRIALKYSQALY